DGLWTNPGITGMYGVSGVGNLFKPGTLGGATPVFNQEPMGAFTYAHNYKFDPSVGFAYALPFQHGWLHTVFGTNGVVRGGFGGNTGFAVPTLPPPSLDHTYPAPSYPIPVQTSNNLNAYDPNLRMEYVQSWDFGVQRELGPNTAVEVRYVGNHGTDLFRVLNLNEVNIFENSFLQQFQQAQQNLAINRQ